MFLVWLDDDRRKTMTMKIAEALDAYEKRMGGPANLVLVHADEVGDAPNMVRVRPVPYMQRSNFYVGVEESA
jgi:hypothetical protein